MCPTGYVGSGVGASGCTPNPTGVCASNPCAHGTCSVSFPYTILSFLEQRPDRKSQREPAFRSPFFLYFFCRPHTSVSYQNIFLTSGFLSSLFSTYFQHYKQVKPVQAWSKPRFNALLTVDAGTQIRNAGISYFTVVFQNTQGF